MENKLQQVQDTIRIPLYSEDAHRQFAPNTVNTYLTDGMLINCWAKRDKSTGQFDVMKRSGLNFGYATLDQVEGAGNDSSCVPLALIAMEQCPNKVILAYYSPVAATVRVVQYNVTGQVELLGNITITGLFGAGIVPRVFLTEITIAGVPGVAVNIHDYGMSTSNGYYAMAMGGTPDIPFFLAGSLVHITDVDYPGNITGECAVGPFVQINDAIYIMGRTSKVYNAGDATSNIGTIASWHSRGVVQAAMEPDRGLGLCKYKNHIVAFGETSVEFFEDAGLAPPGSKLQRIEAPFIKFGALNSATFLNIDDVVYWVSGGSSDTRGLWKLEQYSPVPIRIPVSLNNAFFPLSFGIRLSSIMMGGTQHLLINNIPFNSVFQPALTINQTFVPPAGSDTESHPITANDLQSSLACYSIADDSWWFWADGNVQNVGIFACRTFNLDFIYPKQVIFKTHYNQFSEVSADSESRMGFILSDTIPEFVNWDDFTSDQVEVAASPVCFTIQLPPFEFQSEKIKFCSKMKVIADYMIAYDGDVSTGYQMYVIINKNDNTTYGSNTVRNIPLPNTFNRYYLNNLGPFRKMSLCLISKNKMPFRGHAIELDVTSGTA